MVHIKITDEIRDAARLRADRPVYNNSHRKEAANIVGCLGEIVVERVLEENEVPFKPVYTYTHDLVFPDGKTMEIKTKDRTVRPRPDYDCTIPLESMARQTATMFTFVSLYRPEKRDKGVKARPEDYTDAYVVGVIGRGKFDRLKKRWDKDSVDPSNGTRFWTDCYNVYINQLTGFDTAMDLWRDGYLH